MRKFIIAMMLIVFCMINGQAKDLAFYAPDEDVSIFLNSDNSIALIKQVVRFHKYNSWYVYSVKTDENGDMNLYGVAEIKEASPKDNFVDKQTPENITISGLATEHPRISGKFTSSLTETPDGCNDRHWEIARSLVFHNENRELFSPDSVANLSTNASALIQSYRDIISRAQMDTRKLKATHELKTNRRNAWGVFPLLVPFLIGIVLYQLYIRRESEPVFLKWIALNEILGLGLTVVALMHLNTYWWLIVLAAIAFLGIQVTNLFVVLHLNYTVTGKVHHKLPKWQSIVFAYIALVCSAGLLSGVVMFFIPDITASKSMELIVGLIVGAAVLAGIYFWYRGCIKKYVPELSNCTLAIAVILLFGAMAILSLIIFIVAFAILKGTGKAFLKESLSAPDISLKRASDTMHSCSNCGRLGHFSCPNFKEEGTPTTCSSWIPN